jgi:hypothetical protein
MKKHLYKINDVIVLETPEHQTELQRTAIIIELRESGHYRLRFPFNNNLESTVNSLVHQWSKRKSSKAIKVLFGEK